MHVRVMYYEKKISSIIFSIYLVTKCETEKTTCEEDIATLAVKTIKIFTLTRLVFFIQYFFKVKKKMLIPKAF